MRGAPFGGLVSGCKRRRGVHPAPLEWLHRATVLLGSPLAARSALLVFEATLENYDKVDGFLSRQPGLTRIGKPSLTRAHDRSARLGDARSRGGLLLQGRQEQVDRGWGQGFR